MANQSVQTLSEYLSLPVTSIKGVAKARAEEFAKGGIFTLGDLLSNYPRDYLDQGTVRIIAELRDGDEALIRARITQNASNLHVRRYTLTRTGATDGTGLIRLVWFNQPYLVKTLVPGAEYLIRGKVKLSGATLEMSSPKLTRIEEGEQIPQLVPVYRLWGKMTQKIIGGAIASALDIPETLPDYLPDAVRKSEVLADYRSAVRGIHSPETVQQRDDARRRLVFDEFFLQQLALRRQKKLLDEASTGVAIALSEDNEQKVLRQFPFALTGAQSRAWNEIKADLAAKKPMNRLVQGDVGSGKTAVALLALAMTAFDGFQGAMMAPTEVLAGQHYRELKDKLEPLGIRVALLTGSMKAAEKRAVTEAIASGEVQVVTGTHALIQDTVSFARLGLVITDEQHRFGVRQRLKLSEKGDAPNVLIMTATPIPRTLAMTLFGDMDLSVIDELPPGRTPIKTYLVDSRYDERLQAFMRKEVEAGHQVYIICPAIEADAEPEEEDPSHEMLRLSKATEVAERLSGKVFPDLSVGLLHGRMSAEEKNAVMEDFVSGRIDILVSTTVVEVGVNVPNATLMIIENAERFGLAQLHQLRGRVGRGKDISYCVLKSDTKQEESKERLTLMTESTDGFYIAEQDLRFRGAGDLFGLRQHGLPEYKIADPFRDTAILSAAGEAAERCLEEDPSLEAESYDELREMLDSFLDRAITVG